MIAKTISPEVELLAVNVKDVRENPRQTRTDFDKQELTRLAASIKAGGLLQPIGVRPLSNSDGNLWELIWGERRLRATKLAGKKQILARICDVDAPKALVMMGDENLMRNDWNAIEKARYLVLLGQAEEEGGAGMSDTEIAKHYRKSPAWVKNLKRMLALPDEWQQRVISGEMNPRSGRHLVSYADQPAVLEAIKADMEANPWAWRTAEDVERNARAVAENIGGRTPTLKPRKAAPQTQKAVSRAGAKPADNGAGEEPSDAPERAPIVQRTNGRQPTAEPTDDRQRMTELAESFPSLKGAPGVNPWDAQKLFHCIGPMSHGEQLAALFCLHVWDTSNASWDNQPFDLFAAFKTWDAAHLDALRAWLVKPFLA